MFDLINQEEMDKANCVKAKESGKIEKERQIAGRLIKQGKLTLEEIEDCTTILLLDDLKQIEAEVKADQEKVKNPIFKDLFGDKKYLLRLYRDFHPEDEKATADDITDVTLCHICDDYDEYYRLYNYLGFKVGSRLMLILTLSSWADDIIIRALTIMPDTYKRLMESSRQNMNGSEKSELSMPELYVACADGSSKEIPETLSLSDECFEGINIPLNDHVKIKVLSQPDDKTVIGQYIFFWRAFDAQSDRYGYTKQAIRSALDECKKNNVLTEYIEGREQRLTEIMFDAFDPATVAKSRIKVKERDARYQEGKENGKMEVAREAAEKMIKDNLPLENIEKWTKLSMDELKQIEAKVKANGENE